MLKKLIYFTVSILLIIPVIGILSSYEILAESDYSISCPAFELSYIEDDGSLRKVECYDNLDSAKAKMKELGGDHVVRNAKSLSPTKIVAMNSGLAYTYAVRSGSTLQNIYTDINDKHNGSGATTYLTSYYEMTYHDTSYYTEYFGYSGGYVYVTMNGFTGYADLEYVDLVPEKYIKNSIPIYLGGNDKTSEREKQFLVTLEQNYYSVKTNGNYKDLIFTYHLGYPNKDGKALTYSITIGIAPAFMEEGVKYYSNDGINFYKNSNLSDLVGTNYNYYQFLPLRSRTDISADTINAYLNEKAGSTSILLNHGNDFIDNQKKYGVNGATILAMAIHESGWGKSNIAINKNNLFGWGAYDENTSNAKRYDSVSACIEAQMADNLANYMDVAASVYFSMSLGNKGGGFITKYASDPYWAEKISQYYYDLDKYANNYNGNLTDYNKYALALVKTTNAEIKKDASASSPTLYTTANVTGYQKNLLTIVYEVGSEYTKVCTSNPLSGEDKEVIYPIKLPIDTLVVYDKDLCMAYMKNADLEYLNNKKVIDENPTDKEDIQIPLDTKNYFSLSQLSLDGNNLTISGTAFFEGFNFNDSSLIKHQLVLKDFANEEDVKVYDLQTGEFQFNLNDGFTYQYIAFNGEVSLSDLNTGNYLLYIRVNIKDKYKDILIQSTNKKFTNIVSTVDNNEYRYVNKLATNSMYSYRLELEISSSNIDYSTINKPETRSSMFGFDSLKIEEQDGKVILNIDAHAMIYYLNYDNLDNLAYKVYLVKSSKETYAYDVSNFVCPINYSQALNSAYKMDYICFTLEADISDLQGEYDMIVEITNNQDGTIYRDYVEMSTATKTFEPLKSNNKTYSVSKTVVRNRTILKVE